MKKKILIAPTSFYDVLPSWLFVLLACLMVDLFFFTGSAIAGLVFGSLAWLIGLVLDISLSGMTAIFNSLHVQLLCFGVVAAGLMIWVKFVEKRPISSLGFFKMKGGVLKEIAKGWLVGTVLFSVAVLFSYLFGGVTFVGVDFSLASLCFILTLAPLWFVQGGTEELLTRGWLLPLVNRRCNLAVAVGVSSFLFGLMHLGNAHVTFLSMLDLILSGILMALYMLKTDNIWGVAALHGAWNFTQGNLYGIAVSGQTAGKSLLHFAVNPQSPDWLSGGAFGTEGSLMACLVECAGIAYLLWALKKEEKKKKRRRRI